ncbi:MAG: translation initiation factor [Bdellovibrionota bacterium]
MSDTLVFSTKGDHSKKKGKGEKKGKFQPSDGPCKVRLETKGRGGKKVTVLFNLPFDEKTAKIRLKEMQPRLGCGATLKNGEIEFRGDVRNELKKIFAAIHEPLVMAGG